MSLDFTPQALSFSITSRTISKEEWACGWPLGTTLIADHVAGLEEVFPGLDRVGGAGERLHAIVESRLDRTAIPGTVMDHSRILHLDHTAGVQAGRRILAQGFPSPP